MVYTEKTKRAMKLILKAHEGQFDKGGYPYVYHPIHLAERMEEESTCLLALLHDVVEDCPGYNLQKVIAEVGLTEAEGKSLGLLTHDEEVPYVDYVLALAPDKNARKVKIADLTHNLDLTRLDGKAPRKYETMTKCLHVLTLIEEGMSVGEARKLL